MRGYAVTSCLVVAEPSFVELVMANIVAMAIVAGGGLATAVVAFRNLPRIRTWLESTRDSKS